MDTENAIGHLEPKIRNIYRYLAAKIKQKQHLNTR